MKRLLVAVVALTVASALRPVVGAEALGGQKHTVGHADDRALSSMILGLEEKRIAAMVSKDIVTLDALLADDLSYTHSGGTTDSKASFIALIKERGRYLGVDYSNTQVIPFPGGTTVAVRGRAQIRLEGVAPYPVLFLDVWALRDGVWKMVAWQATRIPDR
jgi:hypothetical protein